jgi:hypothetical protein
MALDLDPQGLCHEVKVGISMEKNSLFVKSTGGYQDICRGKGKTLSPQFKS